MEIDPKVTITISKAELQELIAEGVKTAFTQMGVDTKNPLETQRDFAFLRDMRTGTKSLSGKVVIALFCAAAIALAGWAWYGYTAAVNNMGIHRPVP